MRLLALAALVATASAVGICNDRDRSCSAWGADGECTGANAEPSAQNPVYAPRTGHTTAFWASALVAVARARWMRLIDSVVVGPDVAEWTWYRSVASS